jgi:ribosomal protein S18 acetylase RimI-like enzyme
VTPTEIPVPPGIRPSSLPHVDLDQRPLTRDDVFAWTVLMAAAEGVDKTGEHYSAADLAEEFDDPECGPDDRWGVWAGEILVGFAGVRTRGQVTTFQRIDAEGTVHPLWRGRGIGTALLGWVVDRAEAIRRAKAPDVEARVHVLAFLDNGPQLEVLQAAAFEARNWSALMRAELADLVIAAPVWPAGLSLYAYGPEWTDATRAAHNLAFRDHWGFVDWTAAAWQQWVDGSRNFRPAHSWVVVDDTDPSTVVGYAVTDEFDAYEQATGRREAYLAKLGVLREYRGRWIAAALLRHALGSYRAAGFDESALDVDTNNPTGAFGLYERVGYAVERRTAIFVRVLAVADTG